MGFGLDETKVIPVDIKEEMGRSYIDYAMSVIVRRALPDVRDGCKPVHRRILYTMNEDGFTPDKPHRKCATTVGDVLGRYHPHGDAAVYDSLVRMAQSFSLRYLLVDGHGNFGSIDGDSAAAYRYTEARMSKLAAEMLADIEKETVDYMPNYDERLKEPVVLPSRFPNLLVNGSSGIAVGMATNIPPHNLREIISGIVAFIDNPEITIEELMDYIKGPDFPTGARLMGLAGARDAYRTGRGRLVIRAQSTIETTKEKRQAIIVTEIPYMVNKARLVEKVAELVKEKRIEGISYIRDESDRDGMRIVMELKRDANSEVVLNQLYRYTQMQETFGVIMLALVNNEPKLLNLKEVLNHYVQFQKEIITRRSIFDRNKAQARAHILEGLRIALDHIDEIISIIRNSYSDAKGKLIERFNFSDIQATAILDMRLARLQGLEREKIDNEYNSLIALIKSLDELLASEPKILDVIKEELGVISKKFGDERRTTIEPSVDDVDMEDLIAEEDNVITLTHYGYIKRISVTTYRAQKRGGRGVSGLQTREEDFVETVFVASTHCNLLFFTNKGRLHCLKAYQLPEVGRQAKGSAIVNLLNLGEGEKVSAIIPIRRYEEGKCLLMATQNGIIKKTALCEYENVRKSGKIAISLDEDDELIKVELTNGSNDVLLGTSDGMLIRFNENSVRSVGRSARGVRGIKLNKSDTVIGMSIVVDGKLLIVSENGFGKKTRLKEFKMQGRGGKGVLMYKISPSTGKVAGMILVDDSKDILAITNEGVMIRTAVKDISTFGRTTKGVRIIKMADGIKVVGLAALDVETCP